MSRTNPTQWANDIASHLKSDVRAMTKIAREKRDAAKRSRRHAAGWLDELSDAAKSVAEQWLDDAAWHDACAVAIEQIAATLLAPVARPKATAMSEKKRQRIEDFNEKMARGMPFKARLRTDFAQIDKGSVWVSPDAVGSDDHVWVSKTKDGSGCYVDRSDLGV